MWLQSPSVVTLDPKKMKSDRVATFSPFICHEVIALLCHDLCFLNVDAAIYVYVFLWGRSGLAVPQIVSLKRWLI